MATPSDTLGTEEDTAPGAIESTSDTDTEAAVVEDAAEIRKGWRVLLRRGTVLPAVLILGLGATAGYFGYQFYAQHQLDALRTSALSSAKQYTVDLATYDYKQVGANLDTVTAESTKDFGARYKEVATQLQELLKNGQGVATGKADYSGIVSVDTSRAEVIVFLDQDVKNVSVPAGRTDASRMVITLVRQDGRWLLDKAEPK